MTATKTYTHTKCASAGRPLTEAIARDHDDLRSYYEAYVSAKTLKEKEGWVSQFIWTNARHAISEELVVYNAMLKLMGSQGKEITDKDREAHQRVKDDLFMLQSRKVDDPAFPQVFKTMFDSLWTHVLPEESDDLPAFEALISHKQSQELADEFERTKKFAPTRSHPSAPADFGPFETVAALLAAPMDKLGDMLRTFPSKESIETVRTKL